MVGSALKERMLLDGEYDVVTISRNNLDLLDQDKVNHFLKNIELDLIIIAAAKVGGIFANDTRPAEFIYENIAIASNIIHCAHKNNVQNLLFGSVRNKNGTKALYKNAGWFFFDRNTYLFVDYFNRYARFGRSTAIFVKEC